MEGNNLLHFLDTPSAHYRRCAFCPFWYLIPFSVISCVILRWHARFLGICNLMFCPLFLLKDMRWIWSRKWWRWSLWCIRFVFCLISSSFPFCILESFCVFIEDVTMLIIWGNDMDSGYKAYMLDLIVNFWNLSLHSAAGGCQCFTEPCCLFVFPILL